HRVGQQRLSMPLAQQPPHAAADGPATRRGRRLLTWLVAVPCALIAAAALAAGTEAVRVVAGSNWHEIVPGKVFRSAQLSGPQLRAAVRRFGVRTVINLRGTCPEDGWYHEETATLAALGVKQCDISLSSCMPP